MKKYISPETVVAVLSSSECLAGLTISDTKAKSSSTVLSKEEIWSDEEEEW